MKMMVNGNQAAACDRRPTSWNLGVRVSGLALRALDILTKWSSRMTERRRLRGLDDALLKDIGLTRADAEGEAMKPFWKD